MVIPRRRDPIAVRVEQLGLNRAAASRLSRGGTLIDMDPGTVLCRAGERGTQAFLLLEGEAQVDTGDAVITVGPGEVIGELATLDFRRTRNATVTTTTAVRILVFDVGTYRFLADQDDLRARLAPDRAA
jgi:CRP-like cAMP-binding protein